MRVKLQIGLGGEDWFISNQEHIPLFDRQDYPFAPTSRLPEQEQTQRRRRVRRISYAAFTTPTAAR